MVIKGALICPYCSGLLKYYDTVRRIIRIKERKTYWVKIRRLKCNNCGTVHRELPAFIFPYKQYHAKIIFNVLSERITYETLGYEDYPCEMTMNRWRTQKLQFLL